MTSRPVIGRGAWEASLPEGGKCRTLAAGQASSIVHPFRHHLGRLAGLLRSSEEFQSPTRGGVHKGYAAHSWKSELVFVSDNTQRNVLSSVFSLVRPEIDF
jgi:hypothetical protein